MKLWGLIIPLFMHWIRARRRFGLWILYMMYLTLGTCNRSFYIRFSSLNMRCFWFGRGYESMVAGTWASALSSGRAGIQVYLKWKRTIAAASYFILLVNPTYLSFALLLSLLIQIVSPGQLVCLENFQIIVITDHEVVITLLMDYFRTVMLMLLYAQQACLVHIVLYLWDGSL